MDGCHWTAPKAGHQQWPVTNGKEALLTSLLEGNLTETLDTFESKRGGDDTDWNLATLITDLNVIDKTNLLQIM